MKNSEPTDPRWEKTRELLREHVAVPPLQHPDFINSQVLEAIRREGRPRAAGQRTGLRWLVWSGAGALAAAMFLTVFLPHDSGPRSEEEFISQVLEARAEMPRLSVTSFRVPDDRSVVLWIEGSEFIPASQPVQ